MFFSLINYAFESLAQRKRFVSQLASNIIPRLNEQGVVHVGAFEESDRIGSIYLVLPHQTIDASVAVRDGGPIEFGNREASHLGMDSTYVTASSSLLRSLDFMPGFEMPINTPTRVFQLRTYENPTEIARQKKIQMFRDGEFEIFRRVGLAPVFFTETLFGTGLPNLTYMLSFDDMIALESAWSRFVKDSEWKTMIERPDYSDDLLIRSIRNEVLFPIEASQM